MTSLHVNNDRWHNSEQRIIRLLLDFSCFKVENWPEFMRKFFTEIDVEEEFERELQKLDQNLVFLL